MSIKEKGNQILLQALAHEKQGMQQLHASSGNSEAIDV